MVRGRPVTELILVAALPLAAGCSSFRAGWMDLHNDDLVGDVAPPLEGGTWVDATPWPVDGPPQADWHLVAFLLPW